MDILDNTSSDTIETGELTLVSNPRQYFHHRLMVGELNDAIPNQVNRLRESSGDDILELRISSPGGSVVTGQEIINIITDIFPETSVAYVDSIAYSMAALIFASCATRIVYPSSQIMIHTYSSGYAGKQHEIREWSNFDADVLIPYMMDIVGKYLTKKEKKALKNGKDILISATSALERGLATHIIQNGELVEDSDFESTKPI